MDDFFYEDEPMAWEDALGIENKKGDKAWPSDRDGK